MKILSIFILASLFAIIPLSFAQAEEKANPNVGIEKTSNAEQPKEEVKCNPFDPQGC